MKTILIVVLVLLAVAGGVGFYFVASTPATNAGVQFPLKPAQQSFVAEVPASAEAFAFVPAAATLEATMRANTITRDALESWKTKQKLPAPWMIGGADLLVWRAEGVNRYLLRLDPLRATLVRLSMMVGGNREGTLLINETGEPPIDGTELATILGLAANLPPGQALIVQRRSSRGAFPPLARPAVTSLHLTATQIDLVSRAPADGPLDARQLSSPSRYPQGALLTATFATVPRMVEDLNRLFGTRVSSLLENGGSIAIYDVDSRKFIPRPLGVISVPADPSRRAALASLMGALSSGRSVGVDAKTAEKDGELLLSFDRSLDTYQKDGFAAGPWPAGRWSVHADPVRLVPALEQMSGSVGLRIASPRLSRSARDLHRWIEVLRGASAIDATDLQDPAGEELRVRITSK